MTSVRLKPAGETLVLIRLRGRPRGLDAEDFGANVRMLERAVQIGADRASATHAVGAAIPQSRKWRVSVRRVERGDAKVDLVAGEFNATRRRRGDGPRVLVAIETRHGRQQAKPFGAPCRRFHVVRIVNG